MDLPFPERGSSWDVLIAGAGPAGSMAAVELAQAGCEVLLIDRSRFPRQKVCGCCLNLAGISILGNARVDLPGRIPNLQGLDSVVFEVQGRSTSLRLPGGYAISRGLLDSVLAERASDVGAVFLDGTQGRLMSNRDECCRVKLTSGGREAIVEARVVLCADGLQGTFLNQFPEFEPIIGGSSRLGLSTIIESDSVTQPGPGLIRMAVGRAGYVGRVRLEEGSLAIAAAVDSRALAGSSPCQVVREILAEAAGLDVDLSQAKWQGTQRLTRSRPSLGGRNLFILGDAAGYAEPFTGEGMAWSLIQGKRIAPLAREALEGWNPSLLRAWEEDYRRIIGRRRSACRLLSLTLRSPTFCRGIVAAISVAPSLLNPLLMGMNRADLKGMGAP